MQAPHDMPFSNRRRSVFDIAPILGAAGCIRSDPIKHAIPGCPCAETLTVRLLEGAKPFRDLHSRFWRVARRVRALRTRIVATSS